MLGLFQGAHQGAGGSAIWRTVFSADTSGTETGWGGYMVAQVIAAANLGVSGIGTKIRVTLNAPASGNGSYGPVYIGHAAASGDPYDFDGNQVKLTFSAADTKTPTAGTDFLTDEITFAYDGSKNLVLRFAESGGTLAHVNPGPTGLSAYYTNSTGIVGTTTISGQLTAYGSHCYVKKIEVYA